MQRDQGGGDGHRERICPAPGRRAPRHRAADLDVLVLGDGQADRASTGGPRSTIPTGSRCGPAPASASGARSTTRRCTPRLGLRGRRRPRGFGLLQRDRDLRPLPRRRLLRPAALALGRAAAATGAGARSSSSRSRPTTRSTTTSWPCGCRRSRRAPVAIRRFAYRCTGWPRSPTRRRSPAASRRASATAASPARRGRKGVRKFMVEFLGAPARRSCPAGVMPEPVLTRLARHASPTSSPRRCPTTCRAIGGRSSTSPPTGSGAGRDALLPAQRRARS